jgi:hypothetical protein
VPYRMGRGDFMPGYYRGDPGIFGAITHVLGGAIGGFLTGGPLGAIRGAVAGTVGGVASGMRPEMLAAGGDTSAYTPELAARHRAAIARGARPAAVPAGAGRAALMRGGGGGGGGGRRRMNWANHRALARAERRIHSAVKHMTKYIRWVHPKKGGHAAPKFSGVRASAYPKSRSIRAKGF